MTDIVEELRRRAFRGPTMEAVHVKTLEWRAADEIEKLRRERDEAIRDRDAAIAMAEAANGFVKQVESERDEARRIIVECINRGTDGGASVDCSLEFLSHVPAECEAIKRQRDEARAALKKCVDQLGNYEELIMRAVRRGSKLICAVEPQEVERPSGELAKTRRERDEALSEAARLRRRKDEAYTERNAVVAVLARLFPSGIERTDIPDWDPEWHGIVRIETPAGQLSWHYHDSHAPMFASLPPTTRGWDGHDTPEKYRRLNELRVMLDQKEAGDD